MSLTISCTRKLDRDRFLEQRWFVLQNMMSGQRSFDNQNNKVECGSIVASPLICRTSRQVTSVFPIRQVCHKVGLLAIKPSPAITDGKALI